MPVKTILYEDIYRCVDRGEAEAMLQDAYAEDEMIRHLGERYGEIEDLLFVNYNIDHLLTKVGQQKTTVKKDEFSQFESMMEKKTIDPDDESFESLITLESSSLRGKAKSGDAPELITP
jgi:hypothetical protein